MSGTSLATSVDIISASLRTNYFVLASSAETAESK